MVISAARVVSASTRSEMYRTTVRLATYAKKHSFQTQSQAAHVDARDSTLEALTSRQVEAVCEPCERVKTNAVRPDQEVDESSGTSERLRAIDRSQCRRALLHEARDRGKERLSTLATRDTFFVLSTSTLSNSRQTSILSSKKRQ